MKDLIESKLDLDEKLDLIYNQDLEMLIDNKNNVYIKKDILS